MAIDDLAMSIAACYYRRMKIETTQLSGVKLIQPEVSEDIRGLFFETYEEKKFKAEGVDAPFMEDDISMSRQNVLRGMHGDDRRWKLITCVYGKIFFVAVNCDEKSSDFGKWQSFELSDENHLRILVPPMYGSGYLVLSEKAIVLYKQSHDYDAKRQFAYKWNDPRFSIAWPINAPILSARDQ